MSPTSREPRRPLDLCDLRGKTILVTGASSGIGLAAAMRLRDAGATVLVHGRSAEKTAGAARAAGTQALVADFSRLAEVRRLAEQVLQRTDRLDALLHNAGGFYGKRILTEDGHESTFQTNYLAPFLLQSLLSDLLLATPGSRIVVTTSVASRYGRVDLDDLDHSQCRYRPFSMYATTKLQNILFVKELRRRLAGTTATATAVHPGAVATNFGAGSLLPRGLYRVPIRKSLLIGYFVSTAEEAAEPLVALAARSDSDVLDGPYFDRFTSRRPPSPQADDPELATALWERSEEMVRA